MNVALRSTSSSGKSIPLAAFPDSYACRSARNSLKFASTQVPSALPSVLPNSSRIGAPRSDAAKSTAAAFKPSRLSGTDITPP